jgi:hypothetical protein
MPPSEDKEKSVFVASLAWFCLFCNMLGLAFILTPLLSKLSLTNEVNWFLVSFPPLVGGWITSMLFTKHKNTMRFLGVLFASIFLSGYAVVVESNPLLSLIGFAYAAFAFYHAIKRESHYGSWAALAALALGPLPYIEPILAKVTFSWLTLCLGGGLSVIVASFIEKSKLTQSQIWKILRGPKTEQSGQ